MSNNAETGKRCPNCGAEGKYHGEHETVVKNYKFSFGAVADVGWRCWNCGWEWGFEVLEGGKREKENIEPVFVTEDKALRKGGKLGAGDKEILDSVKTGEGMITIESVEQLQEMAKAAIAICKECEGQEGVGINDEKNPGIAPYG